ncbi:MAG: PTS system mannose/fructose/sorbose family transporter subunit IID [Endomicrobia bacterium]|nr:PTS system mannose/fructose/sorbose family transporter subunit IID [Endomicrobiia bacterium]MCL2507239.1 PTS system mannose/fructose/sorbose family transporter subunit IID [Endomicrobiia bacterium]
MLKIIYTKMFIKSFFVQALWNYERLQNIGFLFVIKPFLDNAYPDKNERREALMRHTGFFNTHPYMANIIIAITANTEAKMAKNETIAADVNLVKSSMAGPLAAIGDSFFWGTLRPLAAFICVFMVILFSQISEFASLDYGIVIPIYFLIIYNTIHIPLRYWFMFSGFKLDRESIALLSKFEFKYLWEMLRYTVLAVIIVSIILYFKVFGFGPVNKNFFGASFPDALIYGAVLVLSFILGRFSATFMVYMIVLACIAMAYLGM